MNIYTVIGGLFAAKNEYNIQKFYLRKMVATNMYANTLGRLMREIMSSRFVMLTKMDYFKLILALCATQILHNYSNHPRGHTINLM